MNLDIISYIHLVSIFWIRYNWSNCFQCQINHNINPSIINTIILYQFTHYVQQMLKCTIFQWFQMFFCIFLNYINSLQNELAFIDFESNTLSATSSLVVHTADFVFFNLEIDCESLFDSVSRSGKLEVDPNEEPSNGESNDCVRVCWKRVFKITTFLFWSGCSGNNEVENSDLQKVDKWLEHEILPVFIIGNICDCRKFVAGLGRLAGLCIKFISWHLKYTIAYD